MSKAKETQQTATHTPGRWTYDFDGCPLGMVGYIIAPDPDGQHPEGIYVAEIDHDDDVGRFLSYEQHKANARRICAAVNACQGISTEALERGAVSKLLEALTARELQLREFIQWHHRNGVGYCEEIEDAWEQACNAIAEATADASPEPRKPIVIEVLGGVVQDVLNVPPGYQYEIKDYDNLKAENSDGGRAI